MANRSQDWLTQAERDLAKAKLDLEHEFCEWACFTAQQAGEKAVKALVFHLNGEPWGHSVVGLLKALKGTISIPEQLVEAAQLLDAYYISARYPDGWVDGKPADYFNQRKGKEALDAAQELFKFVRDLLP